jgi:hypothetical protein
MDKNILQLQDGFGRVVNRTEFDAYQKKSAEGITSIHQLEYNIIEETGFVDVTSFNTDRDENVGARAHYDLRKGAVPFPNSGGRRNARMKMFI